MFITTVIVECSDELRQDAIFDPLFFNIYIEGVIKEWQERIRTLLFMVCS
jgi:hypothetical protein